MEQKEGEWLAAFHNERGFSGQDLHSLCQLGDSQKDSSVSIGRKGIGFKSIFAVSGAPHIFSGPRAIRFDANRHGPYGYICPEVRPHSKHSRTRMSLLSRRGSSLLSIGLSFLDVWSSRPTP